jgi:cell division protein FtsB
LNGADNKHIGLADEGGVALAAIQGLNLKVEQRDAEIQTLRQQNEMLEQRLQKLEQTMNSIAETK